MWFSRYKNITLLQRYQVVIKSQWTILSQLMPQPTMLRLAWIVCRQAEARSATLCIETTLYFISRSGDRMNFYGCDIYHYFRPESVTSLIFYTSNESFCTYIILSTEKTSRYFLLQTFSNVNSK